MDNLDLISDDELRRRLMQYGFPNLPVTSTSRKILIKKLRNYMDNEKLKLRRETTNATRYSSDEEASDRESKKRNHRNTTAGSLHTNNYISNPPSVIRESKKRNHRATIAGGQHTTNNNSSMPPPIMAPKRSALIYSRPSVGTNLKSNFQLTRGGATSVYISPLLQGATDTDEEFDYNTENHAGPGTATSSFLGGNSRIINHTGISYPGRSSASAFRSNAQTYAGGNSFIGDDSGSDSSARRSFNGSLSSSQISPSLNGQTTTDGPFLSDFTKRLLNLRGTTVADSRPKLSESMRGTNRTTYFKDSFHGDCLQSDYSFDRISNQMPIRTAFSAFLKKFNEQYGVKQTFVPCLLLSGLVIFFSCVAFMYMTISPDLANMISSKEAVYSVCQPGFDSRIVGVDCLEKSHLDTALSLLKETAVELQKRAEYHKCVDANVPYILSAKDVINMAVKSNPSLHVLTVMKDLHNMEYLIHINPHWRIRHTDSNGNTITLNEVNQLRTTQENFFAILKPRLPLLCSLYNKLQTFFFVIGGIGIAAFVIYACYFLYYFIVGLHQARKEKVNILITDIINALMDKSAAADPGNSATNLVVVNHLRDKLIAPSDRRKMDWAWQAAIEFLEQNESRIQFEIGNRNGEDCKMMRWIDSAALHANNSTSVVKRWQSPAFDKTNKVRDPPTPCLKIRQMFDSYEANNPNLKQIIQDAILEKVGSDCKIYDIELDKNSCCVYVRCATPADAGLVHDRINGWWFDSSLVSIKFLRLDRYLSRFPKSTGGPAVLRPSNTKNLSMTGCRNDCSADDRHDGGHGSEDD